VNKIKLRQKRSSKKRKNHQLVQESNLQPPVHRHGALPTELRSSATHSLLFLLIYVTSYMLTLLYNRRPREGTTKAEPGPNPDSNPTITCELLTYTSPKVQNLGHYRLPVPKVQDPGQLLVACF